MFSLSCLMGSKANSIIVRLPTMMRAPHRAFPPATGAASYVWLDRVSSIEAKRDKTRSFRRGDDRRADPIEVRRDSSVALIGKGLEKEADALPDGQLGQPDFLRSKRARGLRFDARELAKLLPILHHAAGAALRERRSRPHHKGARNESRLWSECSRSPLQRRRAGI